MKMHLVRGLNKRGTRMIRVEQMATSSTEALAKVRAAFPDAGALSVRPPPHVERVLEQLAQHSKPGDLEC